jgi:hypothetical protein
MNRRFVFWSTFAVGPLILLSYWRGVSAFEDPVVYWGNVSSDMQSFIVPWMFVAGCWIPVDVAPLFLCME